MTAHAQSNPIPKSDTPDGTTATTTRRVADAIHSAVDDTALRAEQLEEQVRERAAIASEKAERSKEAASEQIERTIDQAQTAGKGRVCA